MSQPRRPLSGNSHAVVKLGIVSQAAFAREMLLKGLSVEQDFIALDFGSGGSEASSWRRSTIPTSSSSIWPPPTRKRSANLWSKRFPAPDRVVVHRNLDPDQHVRLAEAGCVGFVATDASYQDLVRELRTVLRQEPSGSPQLVGAPIRSLRKSRSPESEDADHLGPLSARERELARLLERRYSNKEIAAKLAIECGTVKTTCTTC